MEVCESKEEKPLRKMYVVVFTEIDIKEIAVTQHWWGHHYPDAPYFDTRESK
jgi:hypothetical protein